MPGVCGPGHRILRMMFSSETDEDARAAGQAVQTASVVGNAELYRLDWTSWKRGKRRALDLLSRLALRTDPAAWPLSAEHDECMTTFLAGHETVAATLTWRAWCMAANPQAQATARHEVLTVLKDGPPTAGDVPSLVYLEQTLQETLRLYPAVPLLFSRRAGTIERR